MISRTHNDQGAGGKEHNRRKDFQKYRRAVIDIHVRIESLEEMGTAANTVGNNSQEIN